MDAAIESFSEGAIIATEDVQRAAEAGFDAHVAAKPPDPEKLAALLG